MYNHFFGFKERPFKLVPNPAYLFLSRSHEEALAHLNYAVSEGDGFVEITGEVGTGKTTLCRAFLETLDDSTKTAFIFNPKLDSIQLLKAINDEFGIDSERDTTKGLVDVLNLFLMEQKQQGARVVLLIDEAQNLSVDVLEQLRLLSNLETTRDKLLQIILVGQPELGDLLDSHELRQLAQRITLSCHLKPFDKKETRAYIDHRISIASTKAGVTFTKGAHRLIYRYAKGIPRLINIVCDRALLTAFGLDKKTINAAIVKTAIKELSGRREMQKIGSFGWNHAVYFSLAFVLLLVLILYPFPGGVDSMKQEHLIEENMPSFPRVETPSETISAEPVVNEEPVGVGADEMLPEKTQVPPEEMAHQTPESYFKNLNKTKSRQFALNALLGLWGEKYADNPYLDNLEKDDEFFTLVAKQHGFLVLDMELDFDLLNKLNLPAIMQFYEQDSPSFFYLVVCRMEEDRITLLNDEKDEGITFKIGELSPFFGTKAILFWKDFYDYGGTIPTKSTDEAIMTLKMHLKDLGFNGMDIHPVYDKKTRAIISWIQKKNGIKEDGLVGPVTKIILYNELGKFPTPKIKG